MRVRNAKRTILILLSILLTLFFAISLTIIIKTHVDIEAALSGNEHDEVIIDGDGYTGGGNSGQTVFVFDDTTWENDGIQDDNGKYIHIKLGDKSITKKMEEIFSYTLFRIDTVNGFRAFCWTAHYYPIYLQSINESAVISPGIYHSYKGCIVTLNCDLDLQSAYNSVDTKKELQTLTLNCFSGSFDGQYHTITNISNKNYNIFYYYTEYAVFCQMLNPGGIIKNLKFKDIYFRYDVGTGENSYVGTICKINSGTIENCIVENVTYCSNKLQGNCIVAGITWKNIGTIKNCIVGKMTVETTNNANGMNCYVFSCYDKDENGNISDQGVISNCVFNGSIINNATNTEKVLTYTEYLSNTCIDSDNKSNTESILGTDCSTTGGSLESAVWYYGGSKYNNGFPMLRKFITWKYIEVTQPTSGGTIKEGSLQASKIYIPSNNVVINGTTYTEPTISTEAVSKTFQTQILTIFASTITVDVSDGYSFTNFTLTPKGHVDNNIQVQAEITPIEIWTLTNWELTATLSLNTYTITYNLNGGSVATANPTSYTVETEDFTLTNPTRTGYTFTGWTGTGLESKQTTVTIEQGSTGDKTYTANWAQIYSITWNLNGGTKEKTYTDSYTVEDTPLSFTYSPTRTGYTFTGWTGSNGTTPQKTITLASGTTGNKSYTANWQVITYNITYNLNGGSVSTANPTTYTIETTTFTLTNPTKSGYEFKGWTGTNGTTPSTNISISKGSIGDRNYTANWGLESYKISWDTNGGTKEKTYTDSYTVEDTPLSFTYSPTRTGYTFTGWTGSNGTTPQKTITLASGTTGNKSYTANWQVITYNITYNLNGGSVSTANPTTYTIETTTFTLTNPTKSGYEFKGWTGSNGSTPQTTVKISKGSIGNKSYTANWGTITYNITYDLTNGKLPSGKTNPSTYTVETTTFTLNNPEMTGHTFTGWTGTGLESKQTTVTIEQGSTGDRTYTANWEVTRINITFSIVDGATMYVNDVEKTADYTVTILYNQEITTKFDGANNTYSYILTTKDNVQIEVKYIPTLRKMCVSKFNLPNEIEDGEETSREEPSWEAKTEDIDGTTFTITPTISLKRYGVEMN